MFLLKSELQENLKKMEEERDSDDDNTRLNGQIELLKKEWTEITSDFNRNNVEEKDVERTEPTSVPVVKFHCD